MLRCFAVVLSAAVALLVTGCGAQGVDHTRTTTAVKWAPLPALRTSTPTPLTVPSGTMACTASQLRGQYVGGEGLTGEQIVSSFAFYDLGSRPCTLNGAPGLRLYATANQQIKVHESVVQGLLGEQRPGQVLLEPALVPSTHGAAPGQAVVSFLWSPLDEAAGCPAPVTTVAKVAFSIGGSWVLVAAPSGPRAPAIRPCLGSVQVGSYQPVAPSPPPPVKLAARASAPTSVIGGHRLRYTIWLSNPTGSTVDFSKVCGSYAESMGGSGYKVVRTYELNCTEAGSLAPGATEPFAMVMPTDAVAQPTKVTLVWGLESDRLALSTLTVSARITVEPGAGG